MPWCNSMGMMDHSSYYRMNGNVINLITSLRDNGAGSNSPTCRLVELLLETQALIRLFPASSQFVDADEGASRIPANYWCAAAKSSSIGNVGSRRKRGRDAIPLFTTARLRPISARPAPTSTWRGSILNWFCVTLRLALGITDGSWIHHVVDDVHDGVNIRSTSMGKH